MESVEHFARRKAMSETRVSDLARQIGVSVQTVYRLMERLGSRLDGHVTKINGVRLVDDDGAAKIREAIGQTTVKPSRKMVATQAPDVAARLEGVERSIMALVEAHRQAIEAHGRESAAIRAEVSRLVEENRALRLRLEPPPEPARQIKAWSPDSRPDPAASMPWWRVAWLSLIAPEQLRRCDS